MKASDLLVQCLEAEQIEYIFGVPGEENADFMISLEQSKTIKFILVRHEQGAAFMADAFGRLTGRVTACLGTLGPGATNLMTGVGDANMDRSPVLVLTGQGASTRLHKESHQVMDVVSMFRPITKWASNIHHQDTIPEVVRKAVRIATNEKPGAVHIELCEDIAKADSQKKPLTPTRLRRAVAADKIMDQIYDRIMQAKRPIILAGNGCVRKRATKQLRQFCEATGIGVVNTFMAKGCVDMDSDYCLYTIGLGTKDIVTCGIDASDLIISIGFDLVEYHPSLWNPNSDKSIIHMDFLAAETDEHYHAELEAVGDLAHSLWMLNERIAAGKAPNFDLSQQAAVRRDMMAEIAEHQDDKTQGPIRPQKILWDLRQAMAPEDILLSDVGAHKMWVARHFQCHEPNTCLISNGFCSMGFALPGAIGAALAMPERRIVAVVGDAGFLMNVQEMETARRLNLDITCMIWEDKAYGLIAWKQENTFGHHTELSFNNPDWLLLAKSFDWHGHRVEESEALLGTLQKAMAEKGPSLIVVPVDYRENRLLTQKLGELTCAI